MFLSNKTDSEILEGLKISVGKEREAASQVLHYLREVKERKLYLKHASSLFEFCMKVHNYSRYEAQARIDAMRLMKTSPEISLDIDRGRLSLTVAAQLQSAFRKENVRRKAAGAKLLSKDEQKTVVEDVKSASTREAERKLATHFPQPPADEQTRPVSQDLTRIAFNADISLMKDFERLKAVYHHQTGGKWEKLFKILAAREIERLDAPPRRAPGMKSAGNSRYVRKQIHQQVWADWEKGCAFTLENGKRCGSRQNLQRDHVLQFVDGGRSERENLRLLCGPHNRHRSDQLQKLRQEFMNRIDDIRREFLRELTPASAQ